MDIFHFFFLITTSKILFLTYFHNSLFFPIYGVLWVFVLPFIYTTIIVQTVVNKVTCICVLK